MTRCLGKMLLLILLCSTVRTGFALELFGVDLETADRDALRAAVKEAGVVLIREAGEEIFYDLYDSAAVLDGSSRLYLGFVSRDQRFAFAEYEFHGIDTRIMLHRLRARYGEAEARHGRFISDRSYRWQRDGIEIRLHSDWDNYKVRLSYTHPANLAALLREMAVAAADDVDAVTVSFY